MANSTPDFNTFYPSIKYQAQVIEDVMFNYDYDLGTHEILLSGSVGSAKTILMSHLIVAHCIMNKGAVAGIGRRVFRDLKGTLLKTIIQHTNNPDEYEHNKSTGIITFKNGSQILPFSWDDGNYTKFRSYEFSMFAIEELTENNDEELYNEIYNRLGRLTHIKTKILISATNPDSPEHWAYKRLITKKSPTVHVYYSQTKDNPFLPKSYVINLQDNLDPKLARRMLHGEWIEINKESVYHAYDKDRNYIDISYDINPHLPVRISFDFNIGAGKPMSCCLFQFDGKNFHFFNQSVIHGARTEDIMEDLESRSLLTNKYRYIIHGDASGKNRDTRNKKSDYDIISSYMAKLGLTYEMQVPLSNPPVRKRHNTVNAYCFNDLSIARLFVYKDAPTVDEGMRLTRLKEGAQYIEDDSKEYQHITTAVGYGVMTALNGMNKQPARMI